MVNLKRKLCLAFLLLVFLAPVASFAADKSRLGFGTQATISGFLSPKLKRVTVTQVQPGSPAAIAGLAVGDQIIEANGKTIAGAPVRQMARQLRDLKSGEHLRLKVKRSGETLLSIDIIVGPG